MFRRNLIKTAEGVKPRENRYIKNGATCSKVYVIHGETKTAPSGMQRSGNGPGKRRLRRMPDETQCSAEVFGGGARHGVHSVRNQVPRVGGLHSRVTQKAPIAFLVKIKRKRKEDGIGKKPRQRRYYERAGGSLTVNGNAEKRGKYSMVQHATTSAAVRGCARPVSLPQVCSREITQVQKTKIDETNDNRKSDGENREMSSAYL